MLVVVGHQPKTSQERQKQQPSFVTQKLARKTIAFKVTRTE